MTLSCRVKPGLDDEGRVIISEQLDSCNRTFLNLREDMKLELTEGNMHYLEYHRKNIFDKKPEKV